MGSKAQRIAGGASQTGGFKVVAGPFLAVSSACATHDPHSAFCSSGRLQQECAAGCFDVQISAWHNAAQIAGIAAPIKKAVTLKSIRIRRTPYCIRLSLPGIPSQRLDTRRRLSLKAWRSNAKTLRPDQVALNGRRARNHAAFRPHLPPTAATHTQAIPQNTNPRTSAGIAW